MRRSILACGLLLAFAGMATAATAARATKTSQGTPSTTTSTTVATTEARHPAGASRRELRTAARWRRHHPPLSRGHASLADRDARPPAGERVAHLAGPLAPAAAAAQPALAAPRAPRVAAGDASTQAPGLPLHPPLRGQLGRFAAARTTAACRWTSRSSRRTAAGSSATRARPITGARSSRSGPPSAPRARGLLAVAEHGA